MRFMLQLDGSERERERVALDEDEIIKFSSSVEQRVREAETQLKDESKSSAKQPLRDL